MTENNRLPDMDPAETQDWLESIDSVLRTCGKERAHFLIERLIDHLNVRIICITLRSGFQSLLASADS